MMIQRGQSERQSLKVSMRTSPQIVVKNLTVVPNYTNLSWEISLEAYSPTVKESINIYEELRHLR